MTEPQHFRQKPIWQRINKLFLITVVVPTLLSSLYFGLIASDVYVSQSRFVIYNPQSPSTAEGGLSSLLQGTALTGGSYGVNAAHAYILSRDALRQLQNTLNVKSMYSSPNIDPINRFGGLVYFDTSFENLYKYYGEIVSDDVDPTSNISTLTVEAYTANDAQRINKALLTQAQHLIAQMNARANLDTVDFYLKQVKSAKNKVRAASLAMAAYRNSAGVFNPAPQSTAQLQLITNLQAKYIKQQIELAETKLAAPANPRIRLLRRSIATIRAKINQQTDKIVGNPNSLATKSVPYERLALDQSFSEKELTADMAALEQARIQAQKRDLYIETIVNPNKPDEALQPKRIRGVLATFVVGLLFWGVFSVILGGIREHNER